MLVLLGILIVVAGFVARINPLVVILVAAIATGVLAAVGPGVDARGLMTAGIDTISRFGQAFNDNRYFHITWLVLPVIGLLERAGLQERARDLVTRVKAATAGRLMLIYLLVRQSTSALGLTSLGGHPQMVRPLIAPMAEGAAESEFGPLTDKARFRIRGMAAGTDNVGLFFGEDIFIAIGSIVLIVGFLEQAGIRVEALHVSLWAIPTAMVAFLVHGARLLMFDRQVKKDMAVPDAADETEPKAGMGR
ncbi:DUF969 domain-containing protein [Brevundimonas naejangsanensis]|uniref:DUF969 domain-containing protein n=1 Tax=Brevundimonas naejangsanensis TaxID=588932 RepID=A0A494RL69_9CAUL|nr:DUF969 domain-containing protein [Brevundimonas naejangsanensis]AYG95663.1 DUF969 domain-containing protein [Brevundimonas naejangsanensis]